MAVCLFNKNKLMIFFASLFIFSHFVVADEASIIRKHLVEDDDLSLSSLIKRESNTIGYLPPVQHLLHVCVLKFILCIPRRLFFLGFCIIYFILTTVFFSLFCRSFFGCSFSFTYDLHLKTLKLRNQPQLLQPQLMFILHLQRMMMMLEWNLQNLIMAKWLFYVLFVLLILIRCDSLD